MILCVGTTPTLQRTMMFARVEIGEVNRASSIVESASGKSLNVARVLATLGEECLATGFVGGDTGRFLRQDLEQANVRHEFVEVERHTRTCSTVIDQSTGAVTELVEESKPVEAEAWDRLRAVIVKRIGEARLLVLSGSLTPGAPQDFYAWCVEQGSRLKIRTIVDASGEPLKEALARRPFLVKPNRSELARTMGTEDIKVGVAQLIEAGASWAIITQGKAGSIVSDGKRFWNMVAPQVQVVSAIGSGDAYAAGVAVAVVRGQSLPEAAKLGVACAISNAMIPVAGHLRREDVERLLPQIQLESF